MKRLYQLLLIASFLPLCWLGMQAVHELGHVLGAWASGGRVARVVLYPLTISRTDLARNPHPGLVVWAGPVLGVLLPLLVLAGYRLSALPRQHLVQFFAGFCLIANGAYVGIGAGDAIGDAGEMLRQGAPGACLWAFGAAACLAGLWVWHRLGPGCGLWGGAEADDRVAAGISCGLLVLTLAVEVLFSPR